MTMFSGICRGGPHNMKPLHHGEPAFNVAYTDARLSKVITGWKNPTMPVPNHVSFGVYRYRTDEKDWLWHPPKEPGAIG